jgi:hypothetical protein
MPFKICPRYAWSFIASVVNRPYAAPLSVTYGEKGRDASGWLADRGGAGG